ncbi:MBL fold metallo-hydrolase [Variovorax sp. J31P179]|uniref:MBL fold metallo-hydrolase n=1 Tax=Variovorax sp. J31P179 TaxID=3053508 RepID=UPI0025786D57|nr:MBL fold metallo-hydrolase [Variovorax sp. J31P179]MDM0084702.1 MBL fold metallo-hydrolase [Variovorax sp. J31P179]
MFKILAVPKVAALMAFAISSSAALAQLTPATTFPNQIVEKVKKHLNIGRELAADDLYPYFAQRCILDQAYPVLDDLMQEPGLVEPGKAFDDLYFVGQVGVSAWAVKTSAGLVVFDALNNAEEAETILVAGLKKLGFTPADIRYVVVTHEHRDHFGGAKYLQDTYGAQVVASEVAWASMATQTGAPVRNVTVADGQFWKVGDKTFQFYVTPGHTNGALSTIIPVTDGRDKHMAALYGGFGIPRTIEGKLTQINSLRYFNQKTRRAEVDVIIGNHQVQDQSLYKLDLIKYRRDGRGDSDPNPFVLQKKQAYTRFLAMQEQCVRVNAARTGQVLPDDSRGDRGWEGYWADGRRDDDRGNGHRD